jgi:hypothetical protein
MALTEEQVQDKIEIVGDYKHVQVRNATVIKRDGVEISRTFHIYTNRALDEGVQIPATRELIVADAFTRGWVKTAEQRNAEAGQLTGVNRCR